MMPRRCLSLLVSCAALTAYPVYGQLRIANYNILASGGSTNTGLNTVLQAIGNDNTIGFSKPIDILLIQETKTQATTTQQVVDILNTIYGAGTYARGSLDASTTGGGMTGIVYRTGSVQLVNEVQVGTASTSGAARAPLRFQLRPVGYGANADFYIYNSHYKASDGSSNEIRRGVEAEMIRVNADALGQGARIMYAGDFNTYDSSEIMLTGNGTITGLTSTGNGQAHDPLNRPGNWNNNGAFIDIHTQAPAVSPPSGFVGGGLNSRFDMQYLTDEMDSGEGVSYISGSYHTFMNNGSVPLNSSINNASNTALPGLPNRSTVLTALTTASDHLPIMADYQIPAKMSVSVTAPAGTFITGAVASATISVSNSASVAVVNGADELDYSYTGSGSLSGSGNGIDNALGGSNSHTLSLNTSTAGARTGTISVNSTSAGVASGSFSQTLNYTVLSHANPSFQTPSDVNNATIDFGIVAAGAGTLAQAYTIANLVQTPGFTAGLKLASITGSGGTVALSTNAATFNNLAAGGTQSFNAIFSKSAGYGTFSSAYTLATADQSDLSGATALENLSLNLTGILALGGDTNLDGTVNTTDFNTIAGSFGSAGTWSTGDFSRDGLVNSTDFGMLLGNYGQSVAMNAPSLGAAIPEPASLAIFSAMLGLSYRRRSRLV